MPNAKMQIVLYLNYAKSKKCKYSWISDLAI